MKMKKSIIGSLKYGLHNRDIVFAIIVLALSIGLFSFIGKNRSTGSVPVTARVIQITDSTNRIGSIRIGEQEVIARILSGPYKEQEIALTNHLTGHVLTDRYFQAGDRALLMLDVENGKIQRAKMVDHDRQIGHLAMFAIFAGLLIIFARQIGLRAFVSFIFTVVVLVKWLFPIILRGYDPFFMCLAFALLFGLMTLVLVGGFDMRTLSAIIGFAVGIFFTAILTVVAGKEMFLRGITCDWAVFLLKSGYPNLDLTGILLGSIILGASGAMIDVAISVATAVREVAKANPSLSLWRLIQSGFEVGRTELGTMTTTLLLAYMGVNIFLIMLFTALKTPVSGFLNISMVSHEILRALAGSIGMVMIAPITAVVAGLFYHRTFGYFKGPGQ
jgi:uncharacterized membrane protein